MCRLCISDIEQLYSKDPKLNKVDVDILQEWMQKEAHLPKISDFQMICFLNSCYYGIEATKVCIENYYTLMAHCPEIFSGRDLQAESLKYHLETVFYCVLPKLTKQRYQIFYGKLEDASVDKFNFNDCLRISSITLAINNYQNGPQEGLVTLIDGAGLQLGHILKMHIVSMRKFFFFLQEALPVRLKQIHIINVNPITEKLLNLIKPTLKKELVEQLYCHSKIEGIYEFISKDMLPNDYGGSIGTIKELHAEQIENIRNHADLLKADEELKSDETKRSGVLKNLESLFGIGGTFKKLDID